MVGMAREWGIDSFSPSCNCLSRTPASTLACSENGGVLISPRSQTRGFPDRLIAAASICQARHDVNWPSNYGMQATAGIRARAEDATRPVPPTAPDAER